MVYVIDHVLPTNYFANNLRALSVDMAVLRDLMRAKLSRLSKHLDSLQAQALSQNGSSAMYEPPLINVFTMQWFLTLFATCLPEETVLRVWDSILLEGSEVLLRAAVAIWGKLGGYLSTFLWNFRSSFKLTNLSGSHIAKWLSYFSVHIVTLAPGCPVTSLIHTGWTNTPSPFVTPGRSPFLPHYVKNVLGILK